MNKKLTKQKKEKTNIYINILWITCIVLATLETLLYHLGIKNLQEANLSFFNFFSLIFIKGAEKYIKIIDIIMVGVLLWTVASIVFFVELPEAKKFDLLGKVVEVIIETGLAYILVRYLVGVEEHWLNILISLSAGLLVATVNTEKVRKYLPAERSFSILIWGITLLALFQYYMREDALIPFGKVDDIGFIKDYLVIMIAYIIAVFVYPEIKLFIKTKSRKKYITMYFIIVLIVITSLILLYLDLDFPNTPKGTAYISQVLNYNMLENSAENINKLRLVLNTHVLLRTGLLLFAGVVAPFVLYVFFNPFISKQKKKIIIGLRNNSLKIN